MAFAGFNLQTGRAWAAQPITGRMTFCYPAELPPGEPCGSCTVTPATFEVKLNFAAGPYHPESTCELGTPGICETLHQNWQPHPQDGLGQPCSFTNASPYPCIGNTSSQVVLLEDATTIYLDFVWPLTNARYRATVGPIGSPCNVSRTLSLISGSAGTVGCSDENDTPPFLTPLPFNTVDVRPVTELAGTQTPLPP